MPDRRTLRASKCCARASARLTSGQAPWCQALFLAANRYFHRQSLAPYGEIDVQAAAIEQPHLLGSGLCTTYCSVT
ncbi:hypothetical protein XHV734_0510 [Xanthomonas hortorum pv. vitians]|nr:hypothetical protein XHV734_0510 [Xanthomonas hortorum pv. vitians]